MTAGSNIVFSKDADDDLAGIDLSAGTTGSSVINNVLGNGSGMMLIGGAGKNTITGGAGGDVITGGAKNDVLKGTAGANRIDGGSGGNVALLVVPPMTPSS